MVHPPYGLWKVGPVKFLDILEKSSSYMYSKCIKSCYAYSKNNGKAHRIKCEVSLPLHKPFLCKNRFECVSNFTPN